jgi:Ca2+-binding RTX toxin-like protein
MPNIGGLTLAATAADDTLLGGSGNDVVSGGNGNDRLYGARTASSSPNPGALTALAPCGLLPGKGHGDRHDRCLQA